MEKLIQHDDLKLLVDTLIADESPRALAILLIAFTGARPDEIIRLKHTQILITGQHAHLDIKAAKRSNDRKMKIPTRLTERMRALKAQLHNRDKCFASIINVCSDHTRTAYFAIRDHFIRMQGVLFGEQKYTLKSCRHSMATNALKSGMDIIQVQNILGHKALSSTMHYLVAYQRSLSTDKAHDMMEALV